MTPTRPLSLSQLRWLRAWLQNWGVQTERLRERFDSRGYTRREAVSRELTELQAAICQLNTTVLRLSIEAKRDVEPGWAELQKRKAKREP